VLTHLRQDAKGFVPPPPINCEVLVQCQNVAGFEFVGQANQACIGEIDFAVTVFSQNLLYAGGFLGYLKRNLENSSNHVIQDRFGSAREIAQQIATLGNYGFAGDERYCRCMDGRGAYAMSTFVAVQKGNNNASVEQNRFHLPKPRKCFLFEPRSGIPDENLPRPIMPRFFFLR
jgi:hypothetical protein